MTTTTQAIAEYEPIAAALAGIEKFRGLVVDVTTEKGMKEAKAAHREVAAVRIALEKTRVKVKEDVLARSKLIDGEARRIGSMIAAIEDPLKAQIDAEELRAERERQAAIEAEQRRLAAEEAAKKAAEEQRLAEERAKLAREREAFERQQAEARAKEEEARRQRQAEEEKLAAERRAVEDAQRKHREEQEAREREERRKAEEAEAALRARARAAQEKKEAAEREEQRKITELLDAEALLLTFIEKYGHLRRFGPVVRAIKALKPAKVAA